MESPKLSRSVIWQAGLVVLPVAILSAIALYFLREDKTSIEQEASQHSRVPARQLARRISERAGRVLGRRPIEAPLLEGVLAGGQIRSPKPYPYPPLPPQWPERLPDSQLRLWRAAQDAIYKQQDPKTARNSLAALLASGPSAEARANAEYLLLTLADPDFEKAINLARRSRGVLTESGVPVSHLALLLALEQKGPLRVGLELEGELTQVVHEHPSLLSPAVLEAAVRVAAGTPLAATVNSLKGDWQKREKALSLTRALLKRAPTTRRPWEGMLETSGEPFLALAAPTDPGWDATFIPRVAALQTLREALTADPPLEIPEYAAAVVEIGGTAWRISGGAARPGALVLASAPETIEIAGARHPFVLRLELSQPDLLYSPYRRRMWFIVALVLSSAAAALAGLASLWHGMRRQVQLNELKSNIVSSVSHEMRAPLGSVRLMAESLDTGRITDPAKQKEYVHLIVRECRRLSALVQNMLDFSRIDQGRRRYRYEPVNAAELARQTVTLMKPNAAELGVNVVLLEPAHELAGLRPTWDAQSVEQALVNLVDNAIKHSPAGATVEVHLESIDAGARVRLWVEDRGEGIPKKEHDKIFDLFYRYGSELRRETQGAGIGLSIVKHVVEAHGGRVLVESAPGEGSRFALELPLVPPDARTEQSS